MSIKKNLKWLLCGINALIELLHKVNVFVVIPTLIIIVLSDVILRSFLNMPIVWAHEVLGLLLLFLFFAELPYCITSKELLRVDVLYHLFGKGLKTVLSKLSQCLLIAFGVVLIWQGYIGCIDSLEYEEQAYTIAIPYWPFYLVMAFSGILITAQQVGSFLVACSETEIKPEGRSL